MATSKNTTSHNRTPDSTPLPGGGRWTWDDSTGDWLPTPEASAAVDAPAPTDTTDPTNAFQE